ncbi:MAG: SDR family NAD(P)-dependent oxidoreductase [Bacteroidia bacterium]|nr:SDR family NAD(P)-dependent oxidoreductase [Bacteroidia bacterium]NNF31726.1 SDR family NAD(P)-dependent oxidoreductase [Flavobacteriaceae bacterium]NNK55240.1 SDR family NAD(P)-dependent oxidoreductase [Flavobacteriaceae bacterium]
MIVLGANSEISREFVELMIQKEGLKKVYLFSSNVDTLESFGQHLKVKYGIDAGIYHYDLLELPDFDFSQLDYNLVFCASGYLGSQPDIDLSHKMDNDKILKINYSKLVLALNAISMDLIKKQTGTIIALSSVAGERGRKSNFIYGSAKAGFTVYLSGLRNYLFSHKIHVLTVKPGFMNTKMTAGLDLPKRLTISPEKAAKLIYKGYKRRKNTIYIAAIWRYIMFIIRNIPEFIFKKMSL